MTNRNNIRVRKIKENHSNNNASNKSKLKKKDFINISAKLEDGLNHLLNIKPENQIRVIDLKIIINEAIIKTDVPIEISSLLIEKLEENSNSTVALMSYIYSFILRSKNQGVIKYGTITKKLDLINRKNPLYYNIISRDYPNKID